MPERVRDAVRRHPSVASVTLIGSRARGEATPLSDWDFEVKTTDFEALAEDLPTLVAPIEPLTTLWDPLSDNATFMLILRGPTKVDLLFDEPAQCRPRYDLSVDALTDVDAHFWDWCLWLTSKRAAGKDELLRAELRKMSDYLLRPVGIDTVPSDLTSAVEVYLGARDLQEARLGVRVPRELGSQVARVVRDHAEVS